jgi:hypothetical protein
MWESRYGYGGERRTTLKNESGRKPTEIGSSRYGRCGSFSIEFCSRLSWISIRAVADARASQKQCFSPKLLITDKLRSHAPRSGD